jgi:hypothetical protein
VVLVTCLARRLASFLLRYLEARRVEPVAYANSRGERSCTDDVATLLLEQLTLSLYSPLACGARTEETPAPFPGSEHRSRNRLTYSDGNSCES